MLTFEKGNPNNLDGRVLLYFTINNSSPSCRGCTSIKDIPMGIILSPDTPDSHIDDAVSLLDGQIILPGCESTANSTIPFYFSHLSLFKKEEITSYSHDVISLGVFPCQMFAQSALQSASGLYVSTYHAQLKTEEFKLRQSHRHELLFSYDPQLSGQDFQKNMYGVFIKPLIDAKKSGDTKTFNHLRDELLMSGLQTKFHHEFFELAEVIENGHPQENELISQYVNKIVHTHTNNHAGVSFAATEIHRLRNNTQP